MTLGIQDMVAAVGATGMVAEVVGEGTLGTANPLDITEEIDLNLNSIDHRTRPRGEYVEIITVSRVSE